MVKNQKGLVLHSNLENQYTSLEFKRYISKLNIIHSFSGKENPYDNACIESFGYITPHLCEDIAKEFA